MREWQNFDTFLDEVLQTPVDERQPLIDDLLRKRAEWPWINGARATFIYVSMGAKRVALNLDNIEGDPPFAQMERVEGTTLWHVTMEFEQDDLLDYLLAIDDPMTPIAQERDIVGRIEKYWSVDPRNPARMETAQMAVSVLHMNKARPFPDWRKMNQITRGKIVEHTINSEQLDFKNRKLWVYTPPGYEDSGLMYPTLILQDGQWASGPLQAPYIADALIKHQRMQPVVIAMVQSGDQKDRIRSYVSNDKHYAFVMTELLPFLQTEYRIDSSNLGIGGVSAGAIAAAHVALKNPAVFSHLIMISPPLGRGAAQDKLREYAGRFEEAPSLPKRIFQSAGRYEARARFLLPARLLYSILQARDDVEYKYAELGSGHGLVAFRSVLPEALAWAFPAKASAAT